MIYDGWIFWLWIPIYWIEEIIIWMAWILEYLDGWP
jgi:hypothetical protein